MSLRVPFIDVSVSRIGHVVFALAVAGLAPASLANEVTPAERGLEIAQEFDAYNEGYSGEEASMEMVLTNASGDSITRKMDSKVKERKGGDRSLIEFKWPADVKGTRMLTWTHAKETDDQWLYLPALKRVKRISSRSRTGSFMGSEFSYEDLGSQEVNKFTYSFLAEETLNGRDVYKIERFPTDPKSGYTKQVVWLDKGYRSALKTDYYDRKSKLLKTMEMKGFTQYGKYWRPGSIEVINHQTKKRSTLAWKNRKLNQKYDDGDFDSEALDE
jgi:outer membrane lipoprotein-sorting protein